MTPTQTLMWQIVSGPLSYLWGLQEGGRLLHFTCYNFLPSLSIAALLLFLTADAFSLPQLSCCPFLKPHECIGLGHEGFLLKVREKLKTIKCWLSTVQATTLARMLDTTILKFFGLLDIENFSPAVVLKTPSAFCLVESSQLSQLLLFWILPDPQTTFWRLLATS